MPPSSQWARIKDPEDARFRRSNAQRERREAERYGNRKAATRAANSRRYRDTMTDAEREHYRALARERMRKLRAKRKRKRVH